MSDSDPAILGVQKCGCITLADARPDPLDKHTEKALTSIVREGGIVVRTTVGEARKMPHFLVSECPHDPKGWEPEPYVDPSEKVTLRRNSWGATTVYRGGYNRVGQVVREHRRVGQWYATTGWFVPRDLTADDGGDPRSPVEVAGPFRTRLEAVDHLTAAVPS